MVDTHALGACAERYGGSSPLSRTKRIFSENLQYLKKQYNCVIIYIMTSFERSDRLKDSIYEQNTAARYSFADEALGRTDILIGTDKRSKRFIKYPKPTELAYSIQSSLISNVSRSRLGNLLGYKINSDATSEFETFEIPFGAKPILYGVASVNRGEYSYPDEDMFHDIGELLSCFDRSIPETSIRLIGKIGLNIAIVDYIERTSKGLFFVPGVELLAVIQEGGSIDTNVNYYSDRLKKEFPSRFNSETEIHFIDGYLSRNS